MLPAVSMKTERTRVLLLSVMLAELTLLLCLNSTAVQPVMERSLQPMDVTAVAAADPLPPVAVEQVEVAVVETVAAPVESVEERNDAMLMEAEALFGTPFDHAVVMPFD